MTETINGCEYDIYESKINRQIDLLEETFPCFGVVKIFEDKEYIYYTTLLNYYPLEYLNKKRQLYEKRRLQRCKETIGP